MEVPLKWFSCYYVKKKPQESRVGTSLKGKSWGKTPLGEYRRYLITNIYHIYELYNVCNYRAIWGDILGTTARVPSQGYPTLPFESSGHVLKVFRSIYV